MESARSEGTPHNSRAVLAFRNRPRSFRTPKLGNLSSEDCTLGWYAAPRWGFQNNSPSPNHPTYLN